MPQASAISSIWEVINSREYPEVFRLQRQPVKFLRPSARTWWIPLTSLRIWERPYLTVRNCYESELQWECVGFRFQCEPGESRQNSLSEPVEGWQAEWEHGNVCRPSETLLQVFSTEGNHGKIWGPGESLGLGSRENLDKFLRPRDKQERPYAPVKTTTCVNL